MPFLIITAGPTGSGKSLLIEETFKHVLGRVPLYETFLVDDLIENSIEYKKEIDKIINEYNCKESQDDGKCNLNRPTEDLINAFKQAYFKIRKQPGCAQNKTNLTCDELNDERMNLALQNSKNVVIETTGSYIPSWILNLNYDKKQYKVIFAYTIVSFDVLLSRNSTRALRAMKRYLTNPTESAPRLIDIRRNTFCSIVNSIFKTLVSLRNSCLLNEFTDDSKCGDINKYNIDNLLIFDNSKSYFVNIYDQKKNFDMSSTAFQNMIYQAFGLQESCS